MKATHVAVICAVLAALVSMGSALRGMAQSKRAVPMIKMTGAQLRAQGIAVQSAGAAAFPNSCAAIGRPDLSVSNEMLAAFKARGFTLESLCLGMTTAFRFDPESGKPMPFALLPKATVPLNLPDCFKRATPFTDCRWSYDHYFGVESDAGDQQDFREIGKVIDSIARKQISSGRSEWITRPYFLDCTGKNEFDVEVNGRSLCVILETVVLSKGLPLGYGYALHAPEGDDPDEDMIDLSTYSKMPGVVPFWRTKKPR